MWFAVTYTVVIVDEVVHILKMTSTATMKTTTTTIALNLSLLDLT